MSDEIEAKGEVIVLTGLGKGKTTAALGLACRATGHGARVIFVYFTGPEHPLLGEVKTTAIFGDSWRMIGIKSEAKDISYLDNFTESADTVREAFIMAQKVWLYECDLLVLDDISHHLNRGNIDIAEVLALIDDRPADTTIILTGSSVPEPIMQRADLITEFVTTKQPPNISMRLRRGFDF